MQAWQGFLNKHTAVNCNKSEKEKLAFSFVFEYDKREGIVH